MTRWVMGAAVALGVLTIPTGGRAQEAAGFVELRAHGFLGVEGQPLQLVERARPEVTAEVVERVSLTIEVEAALEQGRDLQDEVQRTVEASALGPALVALGCQWPKEENEQLGISEVSDYLSVERLYLDAYLPRADMRLGRQAVRWGSAFVVNPTDPFPEVLLTEPWKPRAGVNAARINVPVGEQDQVTVVLGADDTLRHGRAAGRIAAVFGEVDVAATAAWRGETDEGLLGMDVRGTMGVGWWIEGSVHLPKGEEPFEEIAAGVDYSFEVLDALVLTAQVYRNGGGVGQPSASGGALGAVEPPECPARVPLPEPPKRDPFAPIFRGRHYAMAGAQLAVTPDTSLSALYVQNLGDGTAFLVPTAMTHFSRLELAASAQVPLTIFGEGGELDPSDEALKVALIEGGPTIDFSGLVPAATLTFWTRVSF